MSWCVVCCELCGAVAARAGSECEAAVGWERAARGASELSWWCLCVCESERRARLCAWRVARGGVLRIARCGRHARRERVRLAAGVRCGRRASWKQVRGGGGLKGPLRHGAPAHCGCACV